MSEGWKCPNCGKAHVPTVLTCPEDSIYPTIPNPLGPAPNWPPYYGPPGGAADWKRTYGYSPNTCKDIKTYTIG